MAAGSAPTAVSCAKALRAFVETGKALLDLAKKESNEGSKEEFIRQKIRIERKDSLLGLIEAGAALYSSLSVTKKQDAEELWAKNNHCLALWDAVKEFQQLEVQWDAFLQRLDDDLQLSGKTLHRNHQSRCTLPDVPLVDARSGETVKLQKYFGRGKKTLLVLIRQFSCLLCRLHIKDLEMNQIYAALGLETSLRKVLNFSNMLLYAEYVADKKEFPRGLPSIQDDMFQLGGDVVLDEDGRVLYSHSCQSPLDRPSLEEMLSAQ